MIVKPSVEDIPQLLNLWRDQYEYHHNLDAVYYVPFSEDLEKEFEHYLFSAINQDNPHILIAKEAGSIVGFITFVEGQDDYLDANIKKFGIVIELYVSVAVRGTGIGKLLMLEVEKFFVFKGYQNIKLSNSFFNKDALNFYDHLGYVPRQMVLFKKIV